MIHQMGQLRVLHNNVLKCWVLSAEYCVCVYSLPLFNLRIRHSRWASQTLAHSVSQSVSQFGISHARKQLPNMVVAVSVCVCAAVYDCNTFLRMSTWPWPRPPPPLLPPLAVICGFLPAWCCLAKSYWIVIAATCDKSMTTKVDKWSTEWGEGCECVWVCGLFNSP